MSLGVPNQLLVLTALMCALLASQGIAHHRQGVPHYLRSAEYPQGMLSLSESVGPCEVVLSLGPGNPDAHEVCTLRVRTDWDAGRSERLTIQLLRKHAFKGDETILDTTEIVGGEGPSRSFVFSYPEQGNYVVVLEATNAGQSARISFPVVVGSPGAPLADLVGFLLACALLLVTVRALKIKQSRRFSATS